MVRLFLLLDRGTGGRSECLADKRRPLSALAAACSRSGRTREAAWGAALSARKKTAQVRSQRKDGQLCGQPPPRARLEPVPAVPQSSQEASAGWLTRTGARTVCAARGGSGSARPQPGTRLSSVFSPEAVRPPASRSARLFPIRCQSRQLQALPGAPAENTSLSARAELHQMLCGQEATGLDCTGISTDPSLIPPSSNTPGQRFRSSHSSSMGHFTRGT